VIEEILPTGVAYAEASADPPGIVIFPQEAAIVAAAAEKRRREFTTGRACAHRAVTSLGIAPLPILPGEGGAPRWPAGVVGSITHCAGYRTAVAALTSGIRTIGVDTEPDEKLPHGLLDVVSIPAERARIRDLAARKPTVSWDRLLFSAKESVYKAWFPLTRRWLGFDDANISINAGGTFEARLLVPGPQVDNRQLAGFTGHWLASNGLIVTAVALPV
jgi:4'-phosphopantetheinyl transferase EntD